MTISTTTALRKTNDEHVDQDDVLHNDDELSLHSPIRYYYPDQDFHFIPVDREAALQAHDVGTQTPTESKPLLYAVAVSLVLRNPGALVDDPSTHFKLPPIFDGSADHIELERSVAHLTQVMWTINARWKLPILILLYADPQMRTAQLRRNMPGMTGKMLAKLLREMERDRLIERIEFTTGRPRIEYRLSQMAQRLLPVLIAAKAFSASRPPRR